MFGDQFIAILSDGTKILYNYIQKTFIMYNSGPVICFTVQVHSKNIHNIQFG